MIDLSSLAKAGYVKKYGPNFAVIKKDEPADAFYLILAGEITIEELGVVLSQGELVGEASFFNELPHIYSARSLTESLLLVLPRQAFDEIIAKQPQLGYELIKKTVNQIVEANVSVRELVATVRLRKGVKNAEADMFSLLPEGHKTFSGTAPAQHDQFLFDKSVTCPICGTDFSTKAVRTSRLITEKVDYDFRQHTKGFNFLWYFIWVCPSCSYANPHYDFEKLSAKNKSAVETRLRKMPTKMDFSFSQPRNISEVLVSFYLALYTYEAYESDTSKTANLWLRLLWLYDDLGDKQLGEMAAKKALELFEESYYNSSKTKSIDQEQKINIILGELCYRLGKIDEALRYMRSAVKPGVGNPALDKQARNRIPDLRAQSD